MSADGEAASQAREGPQDEAGPSSRLAASADYHGSSSLAHLLPPPDSTSSPFWGLPPDPGDSQEHLVDPLLKAKLAHFHDLKSRDPPTHFNESLLGNRSFRNPHIYDKLVAFVGIDERAWGRERHPRDQGEGGRGLPWKEKDTKPQGDLPSRLAEEQRRYTEARQAQQKGRSRIDFAEARHEDAGSSASTPDRGGGTRDRSQNSSSSSSTVASAVERARQAARRVEQIRSGAASSRPSSSSSSSSSDRHKRARGDEERHQMRRDRKHEDR